MLNLGKGYKIYEPEKLSEAYEVSNEVSIMANVGVEKVVDVFQHLLLCTMNHCFLFWNYQYM